MKLLSQTKFSSNFFTYKFYQTLIGLAVFRLEEQMLHKGKCVNVTHLGMTSLSLAHSNLPDCTALSA